jgi:NADH-quinone oxidoreductase subunit G
VGALHERDDTEVVFAALADPDKTVVIQVAPAVRAAWGDSLGLSPEIATQGRMTAALRALGADYVFDTSFAADLTIMEEGSELVERLGAQGGAPLPLLTSCCPGWVRFLKAEYPELLDNLSTAKSPQQMFGAVAKSYFADGAGIAPEKLFCVSVMPCTAKKYECAVPEINDTANRDVDAVLTTREFGRMLRAMQINVAALPEEDFDSPLGEGTGAAVIFGVTGGVMEAAVRSAHFLLTGQNPTADAFETLRGQEGWREQAVSIQGTTVRLAIASGLGNARRLLDALRRGEVHYDFIEVMACPGGCAGGGGMPICDGFELAEGRGARLYALDQGNPLRFSHENVSVRTLYREYLEAPLSHRSHTLLHTHQKDWSL